MQQVAPTETGPIVAATAPSASVEPLASPSAVASDSAAPREPSAAEIEAEKLAFKKKALEEAREFGMIGMLGAGADAGIGTLGPGHTGGYPPDAAHRTSPPSIRQGNMMVNGRLPPEVIHRIVRQNFGRFRLCYEAGLRNNPALEGRVSTRFVIDRAGAVVTAKDENSDMPDQGVVQCVVRGFGNLSFPQPEGGIVTVVAPLLFSPHSP